MILEIAILLEYLEEQLISILAKVGPNVYYRYFDIAISLFKEEEEDHAHPMNQLTNDGGVRRAAPSFALVS